MRRSSPLSGAQYEGKHAGFEAGGQSPPSSDGGQSGAQGSAMRGTEATALCHACPARISAIGASLTFPVCIQRPITHGVS